MESLGAAGEHSVPVARQPQEAEAAKAEERVAAQAQVVEEVETAESAAAPAQVVEAATAEGSVSVPQEVEAAKPEERGPPAVAGDASQASDPAKGKACHQCRQIKKEFAAACTQVKKKGPCPIKYCHKCLLNRYGENDEEVAHKEDWKCPKCRGICNCSCCRKRKGEKPTGIMAPTAKASGCTSVHDLLSKGSDAVAAAQRSTPLKSSPKRALGTDDGTAIAAPELPAEGDENIGVDLNAASSVPTKKRRKRNHRGAESPAEDNGKALLRDDSSDDAENKIVLPRGTLITNIAGAELKAEDVGAAIQFYEFCRTFAEILQIRKGQPEGVLQDICGGRELRVVSSLVAEFHINLLSVIQEGRGEKPLTYSRDGDGWIIDVGKYISESTFISKELPLDCLNQGVLGYKILSPSCKLLVLNFLCDETLSTKKLRNCMAAEIKNAASEKVLAAKEKEPKEILENDIAKPKLSENERTALSIEENKDLCSQIKEAMEVEEVDTKENKLGGALSTKPVMVDKGAVYWKLDGYCNNTSIMLQEVDTVKPMESKEDKWFMFTEDEEKIIKDHASTRSKRQRRKYTQRKHQSNGDTTQMVRLSPLHTPAVTLVDSSINEENTGSEGLEPQMAEPSMPLFHTPLALPVDSNMNEHQENTASEGVTLPPRQPSPFSTPPRHPIDSSMNKHQENTASEGVALPPGQPSPFSTTPRHPIDSNMNKHQENTASEGVTPPPGQPSPPPFSTPPQSQAPHRFNMNE